MSALYLDSKGRHLRPAWLAVPLAAVVAAVVMVSWPQAGEPLAETRSSEAAAPSSYGVPSADSVFKDGKYEIAEPVATF